ncbi:hypothetical protein C8R43DRAFT_958066 [Mycena crocata]|nr:hypothetical protein C8R43DRAFT_958066 [Mycena crocata]
MIQTGYKLRKHMGKTLQVKWAKEEISCLNIEIHCFITYIPDEEFLVVKEEEPSQDIEGPPVDEMDVDPIVPEGEKIAAKMAWEMTAEKSAANENGWKTDDKDKKDIRKRRPW